MKFLLDESTDARLAAHLRELGHDATRVGHEHPSGLTDNDVLAIALTEQRVLITDDRDFGELIFQQGLQHAGVIYLRLGEYTELAIKIARLEHVLTHYADQFCEFVVVSPQHVRVRQRRGR